jgi:tripartite-type tricarboxylate transporter receptor subunit TctC
MTPAARFVIVLACAFTAAPALFAQNYPAKSVRVLVPWPPGGTNDIVARIVAQKLTENTKQQFFVDNRGGAAGTIGAEVFAKMDPDGYSIMIHSATHVANPYLYRKLPYDTLNDFIGVTALARQVGVLVVHPSLPAHSVKELIAIARSRPEQIAYASSGNGSFVHLSMALVASMSNVKMTHVPYKGGNPAATAIVSGETQAMLATVGSVLPQIMAKRLRGLAVSSDERVKQLPQLPTIAESGVPGYEFTAWIGAFVPARTPSAIVNRLNAELVKTLADPVVVENLSSQTFDPMPMSAEAFAKRLRSDSEKYERVIRETGARID